MFLLQRNNIRAVSTLSFAACFFNASSLESSMVHRSDLSREVRQQAERIIQRQGFSAYSLPNKLSSQYNAALEDATQRLQQSAAQRYDGYVSRIELDRIVESALAAYLKNLSTVVMQTKLDTQLTNHINHELATNNITQHDIPSHLVTDFTNAGNRTSHRLNMLMTQDGRNYVRIEEIQKAVHEEFQSFIALIKREKQSSSWDSVWNSLSDWLGDTISSIPEPSRPSATTSTTGSVINGYQIEDRAAAEAARVARQKGIDAANLPATLVSDYADRLSRVISRMRNIMSVYQRNSIYTHELEQAVAQEFATLTKPAVSNTPVSSSASSLPAIEILSDSDCCICLDNYSNGQRVAVLNCGHNFHNECMQQWLQTSKTCPLCRANTPHIPQQKSAKIVYNTPRPAPTPVATTPQNQGLPSVRIDADEECAVCLDNFDSGQRVGVLSCNHVFHNDCIYQWITTNPTCPLCRASAPRVAQQKVVA